MDELSHVLFTLAGSPWALVVMSGILVVDGFFPFVPGETAVVTLATFGATGHGPSPWLVFAVAVVATMVGDAIAFVLGRTIGVDRFGWMRRPRVRGAITWASTRLMKRPAVVLVIAKFIPFVRVIVTMTAGAGGLRLRRYLPISFAASTLYTGYHILVALIAGATFAATPLFGAVLAVATVLILGVVFELAGRRGRRAS